MSRIKYKGEVAVKIKGQQEHYKHNSGTNTFFGNLYNVLAEFSSDLKSIKPYYMSIINLTENSTQNLENGRTDYSDYETEQVLVTKLSIVNKEISETEGNIKFSSLLYKDFFNSTSLTDDCYVLLLNANSEILAYSKWASSDFNAVKNRNDNAIHQATIYWTMSFENFEEQGE